MLEPPPSAKPFTIDVDKKLEEGQKVIDTFLCYQGSYIKQFPFQSDLHEDQGVFVLSWRVATSFNWLAFLILRLSNGCWVPPDHYPGWSWPVWFLLVFFQNIRLLRTELQKLGESLQSAERACCHSTGAGKLRQALTTCDDILIKQVRAPYIFPSLTSAHPRVYVRKKNEKQMRKADIWGLILE